MEMLVDASKASVPGLPSGDQPFFQASFKTLCFHHIPATRTFRILSYRYSPLHRRDVYTLCFILLCCFLLFVYRLPCFQALVNHCSSDSGSRIQPTSSAPRGSPIPGAGAVRGTLSQMCRPLQISQLCCRMDWVNILQQEVGR